MVAPERGSRASRGPRGGFIPAAWPTEWLGERLTTVVAALNRRCLAPEPLRIETTDTRISLDIGTTTGRSVRGPQARLLAWLLGRSSGDDLHVSDGRQLPAMPTTYTT